MRVLPSPRSLWWPSLCVALFAFAYVIAQPGAIYADAYEYDAIARSMLRGQFELREEFSPAPQPTMHREPGYPALRAVVYAAVGDHAVAILWLQALLCTAIVVVTAATVRRLDPRWALPVAWLTALYPGFAVWAGQHYSETFAAFLVALVAYAWVRVWEHHQGGQGIRAAALLGVAIGVLTLTKASFQLLPLFAVGMLIFADSLKNRWKQACMILIAFALVVAPWVMRNQHQFNTAAITYRTGIVIYTRSLKAQIPWKQLATSYGSVLVGEATVLRFFPDTPPILIQLWDRTWEEKNALLHEGMRYYQADQVLLTRGAHTIFSSPSIFARYALWSPIDVLRFFELTSPLSPKFGVERIAQQQAHNGTLSSAQLAIVLLAHALQLVWWTMIAAGFVVLVRARVWRHPSLLLIGYAALLYAPFDNIPRYAVPVLPWIIALIVAAVWRPVRVHRATSVRSRPHILILAESVHPRSGWGAYAHALVTSLRAMGSHVTVLTAHGHSEGPRLPDQHASWIVWRLAAFRLRRWLRHQSVDVVHVTAEVYAQLFRAWGTIPFIVTVHGTYANPDAYPAYAARTHAAFAVAHHLVAVSEWTRSQVPMKYQQRVSVIPNGVDGGIASEPFDEASLHGSPLILSVGALKPRKGFDRLIAGFSVFQQTHPNAELVIIGRADRPDVQRVLQQQVATLGLTPHVRFAGEVSRRSLLGWYRASDVFALTPVEDGGYEGFGLVYLEANVFGKPCVGSRDSGARDTIREGINGFLANPTDAADIASALERARHLSASSITHSTSAADWTVRAAEYEHLYRSSISSLD